MPESDSYGYVAPLWHTLLVLTVQGLLSYRGRMRLAQLQTLADAHRVALYERTILFEWLMLGLVLAGVWWHGSSLLTVLGRRWSSLRHFLGDLAIGVTFLMVAIAMGAMLPHGDGNVAKLILPQGRTEMWLWVAVSLTAGICEEAVYRGYLQRQFISVTRSVPAGIVLSAAVFGVAHANRAYRRRCRLECSARSPEPSPTGAGAFGQE
jgi:uncharacterized protein